MKLATENILQINHMITGKLIRDLRKKKGISLRRLGNALGISAPFLSDMERGRRNWTERRFKEVETVIHELAANANISSKKHEN